MYELDASSRGWTSHGVKGKAFGEAGGEDSQISVSVEYSFQTSEIEKSLVFDRATVGFCFGCGNRFAREGGIESFTDVVGGGGTIFRVGGANAIDSARVDQFTFGVDDVHVGGCFCFVELTYFTRGVEKNGSWGGIFIFRVGVGLGPCSVALLSRGGGDNGEPHNPFRSVLFLQFLHVAGGVVLFYEGAFGVKPLEDDKFA